MGVWTERIVAAFLASVSAVCGGVLGCSDERADVVEPQHHGSLAQMIPRPVEVVPGEGELALVATTVIAVDPSADDEADDAVELLRGYLRPATGLELPVEDGSVDDPPGPGPAIVFAAAEGSDADELGDEGYELVVDDNVEIRATSAAGFGWAVQTLRQLLPPEIDGSDHRPGTYNLPAVTIRDHPRFAWRGVMLDVARHFFPPEDVRRVIDLAAQYKLNRLHLHLTDDQGWRLQIEAYPELTEVGAATEMGGGEGGYYTQDEYRDLVDYAARRGIVVVPEIDMPGHTSAALAAVPELACPGVPPATVATDFSSGDSSLCAGEESTYDFVETVIGEVAELTPGPYIHLGADEAQATAPDDFRRFVERAMEAVVAAGKQPVGWDEMAEAGMGPDTVLQHWNFPDQARAAADGGAGVIMSPSSRAYMDMKYDESTPIGLTWAGLINTRTAYEWDPATVVEGLPTEQILGIEAPLWTETVTDLAQIEQMMLPRLPGYAEIGWSTEGRDWDEYQPRLADHDARWEAAGRSYTRDPLVAW